MSTSVNRVPGSVVELACDEIETTPPWQTRRLERALVRLFPAGCGVSVAVSVAWSEAAATWSVWQAVVRDGVAGMDITAGLRESLRVAGLPVDSP